MISTGPAARREAAVIGGWTLACPGCRGDLAIAGQDECACGACGPYRRTDGIWRMILPERAVRFDHFLRDYTLVRRAEGRGSDDPGYYHRLPTCQSGDAPPELAAQWRIRMRTFDCLARRVLPGLGACLRVLDVGAGVGWLCNRLAAAGHKVCAVDLNIDAYDGLGAARHYAPSWPRLHAEFDRLPLAPGQADMVVFNASLHYSADYVATLAEALRVLRCDGRLIVMDSPIYRREESGRRMVAERYASFERRFGTRSDSLASLEYLTWSGIDEVGERLGLQWTVVRPRYGFRWAARPIVARLRGRRYPSRFAILVGRRRVER